MRLRDWWMLQRKLRKQRQRPRRQRRQLHCQRPKKHRSQPEWFDRHCGLLICARVSDCHGSLLLSNWRVVIPDICHILYGRSQAGANSSAKKKAPDAHPKPFDPNATPSRVIVDVLRHDDSRAVLKGPVTSQALKTMLVQRERMQGGKAGEDSHRKFNAGWKTGRPWVDFRKVTTTDHDSL